MTRLEGARTHAPVTVASLPSIWRGTTAVFLRDSAERRFLGVPFVLDFLFGIVNLLVFSVISRVLHHPGQSSLGQAGSYFDFVAVGITFMLVVQAAAGQVTSRVQREQASGTLEMLVAQPVSSATIALGVSAYPMLFAVVRAAAYLGIASVLLGLDVGAADWLGVAVVLLLGGTAILSLAVALAAFTVAFEHGGTVGKLLIVAVAFVSGTYFPVSVLPDPLRWLSAVLPTRIALDGLRTALAGHDWMSMAALLAATTAIGLPLTLRLFHRAVRWAVGRGTLTRG